MSDFKFNIPKDGNCQANNLPYFVTVCNCLLSSDLSVYVTMIPASGDGDLLSFISRFSSSNETQHSFLIKLTAVAVTVLV